MIFIDYFTSIWYNYITDSYTIDTNYASGLGMINLFAFIFTYFSFWQSFF